MTSRNIITIVGGFFTSFGAALIQVPPTPTAYWVGLAMTILGPQLMAVRGVMKK